MVHIHEYPVTVEWTGGFDGAGTGRPERSGIEVPLSVPPEFKGPGNGTNPEELLATSIAGCYAITFGIIASNRKIPVIGLTVKAVGQVEQSGAMFTYKAITIRPDIVLEAGATDEQMKLAEDMSHKADQYCIITNAVRGKVEITVEPTIRRS